jgi:hypothetical protein
MSKATKLLDGSFTVYECPSTVASSVTLSGKGYRNRSTEIDCASKAIKKPAVGVYLNSAFFKCVPFCMSDFLRLANSSAYNHQST